MWDAEDLVQHVSETNNVVVYDCRGHGKSDRPADYTLSDHVEDAFRLMDHLGFEEFNVLGASMGSYIAQGMAISAPERIRKMVLVVTKSNGKTSSMERIFAENAERLKLMDENERQAFMNHLVIRNLEALHKYPDFLKSELLDIELKAATTALANFDFRHELEKVLAKTLVVSGKYDRVNPPEEGRICAEKIAHAKFVVMQNSAHAPTIEEPEAFRRLVDEFLLP
jgi:3-oxoadipate enol-lactonase